IGPLLLIFFDVEPVTVAGTVLALVAVNSISGTFAFRRMGTVDVRSGLLFAAAATPGAVIGVIIVRNVTPGIFQLLFGVLLLLLALQIATSSFLNRARTREPNPDAIARDRKFLGFMVKSREITSSDGRIYRYQFNETFATAFNAFLGFVSSFFGTGGGFIRTPILVYAFGFPVQVAVATSIFTLSFSTTAGAITHAALGHVEFFPTFVFTGIGLVVGGQLGARLTGRVKGKWILRLLLIVVLVLGVKLLIQGISDL
ncbi:MAG: sulfite exporter TauE/SafE family protein, partial [Chloroflexi bacterium]|nr:sulfite exporter TauE/SafE family protein [Chloroflexota bacterium]